LTRELQVLGQPEVPRERADALRNRTRILEAARAMLKRIPPDALCMDALCAAAGVGKGTLYRRFVDKAALLRALLDEDERALQEDVRLSFSASARGAEARRQLLVLLEKLHAFVMDHAELLGAAEASGKPAVILESPPYAWRRSVIAALLERSDVPPAKASYFADMLMASMAGEIVMRALRSQDRELVKRAARVFYEGVLAGTLAFVRS
jgi:AcrR family transcriptional regulator